MLVARGRIEHRQAILNIGLQRFIPQPLDVSPIQAPVLLPINSYRALLDTGAQRTCLTRQTITAENLVRHGKRPIQNVHSQHIHYLFMANLGFWCEDPTLGGAQDGKKTYYALPDPVEVIDIADNYWFDAIIGMDVLQQFDFAISRSGDFSLALN